MGNPTDREEGGREPEAAAHAESEGGTEGEFRERGRKERVLHTRISEQLAEDLRRAAEDLRVPVSNLVRNVLEETFSVVESVTDSLGTWLEDVATETGQPHSSHRHRRRRWSRHWTRGREGEASPSTTEKPGEPAWEKSWDEPGAACPEAQAQPGESPSSGLAVPEEAPAVPAASAPVLRPDFPEVLGWQPLVMNRAQACADCGRSLVRGDRAYLGLTQGGVSGLVLCRACMDARE